VWRTTEKDHFNGVINIWGESSLQSPCSDSPRSRWLETRQELFSCSCSRPCRCICRCYAASDHHHHRLASPLSHLDLSKVKRKRNTLLSLFSLNSQISSSFSTFLRILWRRIHPQLPPDSMPPLVTQTDTYVTDWRCLKWSSNFLTMER